MNQHFPALVIVIPLFSAFIVAAVGWLKARVCFWISLFSLVVSLYASIGLLMQVLSQQVVQYRLGGWPPPFGIVYEVDYLNSIILVVITAVSLINLVATRITVVQDFPDKIGPFYSLYLLFVTGDAFNLYVLLEISSLTGYALIGMGDEHAPLASLHYIFMGTIGASFYLLGIGQPGMRRE